jgi:uncharacterized membrane protein YqjE
MKFFARSLIASVLIGLAIKGFWDFQDQYPWRAAATAALLIACLALLGLKKGRR